MPDAQDHEIQPCPFCFCPVQPMDRARGKSKRFCGPACKTANSNLQSLLRKRAECRRLSRPLVRVARARNKVVDKGA